MPVDSNRTILVVDDDKDIREFVAEKISKMGLTVFTAGCGSEAIKLLEDQGGGFDLLVSDVVMPGMTGIELAESLANKAPETKVILMSGFMQPSPTFANAAAYEEGFIRKPFSGKTLTSHVKKALEELEDN